MAKKQTPKSKKATVTNLSILYFELKNSSNLISVVFNDRKRGIKILLLWLILWTKK